VEMNEADESLMSGSSKSEKSEKVASKMKSYSGVQSCRV